MSAGLSKSKQLSRAETGSSTIVLANWGRRLVAWLIDYIIINLILGYLRLEEVESLLIPASLLPRLPGFDISLWSPLSILIFFLYWTLSEWYLGRSIGQLLLNVRLVDIHGGNPRIKAVAIQSIGKSFLLPLDCLIGWLYKPCRERRQRFFNKLSNTIVIFIGESTRVIKHGDYFMEP
ncbi:MAG TPA: RDD family protein [Candidatus Bathyarchaeia archaeon]|nr:RDD family protein [Candidatus Bathyarchaeia archaeon]